VTAEGGGVTKVAKGLEEAFSLIVEPRLRRHAKVEFIYL